MNALEIRSTSIRIPVSTFAFLLSTVVVLAEDDEKDKTDKTDDSPKVSFWDLHWTPAFGGVANHFTERS